jgi:hypothetical protein
MIRASSLRRLLISVALILFVAVAPGSATFNATDSDPGTISVTITSPLSGQTVSGVVDVSADLSNQSATLVIFSVDGEVRLRDESDPFEYAWPTLSESDGSHTVTVEAYGPNGRSSDAAVNVLVSNSSDAPGPAPDPSDETSPTSPASLSLSPPTQNALTLAWAPSTDDVAVTGYDVFVNGAEVGSTSLPTYVFSGLACSTTYTLGVEAFDAAGNRSQRASLSGSTSSCVTTPPTSCASGECLPVGDLSGWKQVFTDDFASSVPVGGFSGCDAQSRSCSGLPADVRAKWFAYPDGWRDSATGTYMPSKVMSIQNGLMNLYLHSENGSRLVSAPVPIIPGAVGSEGGLLYGRYAIRFRADLLVGYKTAFLLWPDSEVWPRDGEINFPEGDLAGTPWSTMYAFVHHQGATTSSDQEWFGSGVPFGDWHTAVIDWLPSRVSFILDGRTIGTSTDRLPNTPMHWVLQTPTTDAILASLSTAGNVQIDWVAVWKPL